MVRHVELRDRAHGASTAIGARIVAGRPSSKPSRIRAPHLRLLDRLLEHGDDSSVSGAAGHCQGGASRRSRPPCCRAVLLRFELRFCAATASSALQLLFTERRSRVGYAGGQTKAINATEIDRIMNDPKWADMKMGRVFSFAGRK